MRSGIHPEYRAVVFRDRSAGTAFLTRSTVTTKSTVEWEDGNEYPVCDVEISSASHPFWTGRAPSNDEQRRIARFERRYRK